MVAPKYQGSHLGLAPQIKLSTSDSGTGNWHVPVIAYDFAGRTTTRMAFLMKANMLQRMMADQGNEWLQAPNWTENEKRYLDNTGKQPSERSICPN